jgi:hypothetical protein
VGNGSDGRTVVGSNGAAAGVGCRVGPMVATMGALVGAVVGRTGGAAGVGAAVNGSMGPGDRAGISVAGAGLLITAGSSVPASSTRRPDVAGGTGALVLGAAVSIGAGEVKEREAAPSASSC